MKRAVTGLWWSPTTRGTPALVVTVTFFMLGSLLGGLAALRGSENGARAMAGYLEQFILSAGTGKMNEPAAAAVLWRAFRWTLPAFLFGFTALGLFLLPLLSLLRGFFLAFSVLSFACSYARRGLAVAFLLLGLPGAIYLPVFFLLTTQSLAASLSLAGRAGGQGRRELPYDREYLLRCGVCAAALCVGVFIERTLVPILATELLSAL